MSDLTQAVEAVVRHCLGVKADELVLIVCNPATHEIGERLRAEAEAAGADTVLTLISERASNGAEPPPPVAAAMKSSDVVLAPTVQSLSHTEARKVATDAGVRIGALPGVTEEMLARVMSADLHTLTNRTLAITEALTVGSKVHITSSLGTDFRFDIEGRRAICDAGQITGPGDFGNIPCGEGYVAPLEGSGNGILMIDGSVASFGRALEPVMLVVEDGHLVSAKGGFGSELMDTLTGHGEHGTNVAEFGVGTNEKAQMTGNILEDEKILGTVHIAFGASAGIGGSVQVPIHLDCVMLKPTVEIDGQRLVDTGKLLV